MPKAQEILDAQVRISELFHLYGGLLSERQRTFIEMYYDRNLSLAEIAEQHDITRQAVHDAIKHGRKALFRYERELRLHERTQSSGLDGRGEDWAGHAHTILDEMENSLSQEVVDRENRLRAQIRSLRNLLPLPREIDPDEAEIDEEPLD